MLNRVESKVMDYIYEKAKSGGGGQIAVTTKELLTALLPFKLEITAKELDVILSNLVLDDYIDTKKAEKDGRPYYIVGLTIRGAAFDRERNAAQKARIQSVLWRLFLTAAGVVAGWVLLQFLNGNWKF